VENTNPKLKPYPLPHCVVHSPTGFEWGYGGSGPADTALSILADFLGESKEEVWLAWHGKRSSRALQLHQAFKFAVVGVLPHAGWQLGSDKVAEWLAQHIG
jgi:hypothetical protein